MLKINPEFRKTLSQALGEEVLFLCYQCGKCSAHCPVFHRVPDRFNPRKILEMAYLGVEQLLEDPALWLCTTCYECVENCPQTVNFVDIIVTLRNLAMDRGLAPKSVLDEYQAVTNKGFVYPLTGRIRKVKEELGLSITGDGDSPSFQQVLEVRHG